MMTVISTEGLSLPVSFGLFILPVSCTAGRGMPKPASTSGQAGTSSNVLLNSFRTISFAFDLPS